MNELCKRISKQNKLKSYSLMSIRILLFLARNVNMWFVEYCPAVKIGSYDERSYSRILCFFHIFSKFHRVLFSIFLHFLYSYLIVGDAFPSTITGGGYGTVLQELSPDDKDFISVGSEVVATICHCNGSLLNLVELMLVLFPFSYMFTCDV